MNQETSNGVVAESTPQPCQDTFNAQPRETTDPFSFDGAPVEQPRCGARYSILGLVCTREKDHEGDHRETTPEGHVSGWANFDGIAEKQKARAAARAESAAVKPAPDRDPRVRLQSLIDHHTMIVGEQREYAKSVTHDNTAYEVYATRAQCSEAFAESLRRVLADCPSGNDSDSAHEIAASGLAQRVAEANRVAREATVAANAGWAVDLKTARERIAKLEKDLEAVRRDRDNAIFLVTMTAKEQCVKLDGEVSPQDLAIARVMLSALDARSLYNVKDRDKVIEVMAKFFATHRAASLNSSGVFERYRQAVGVISDLSRLTPAIASVLDGYANKDAVKS